MRSNYSFINIDNRTIPSRKSINHRRGSLTKIKYIFSVIKVVDAHKSTGTWAWRWIIRFQKYLKKMFVSENCWEFLRSSRCEGLPSSGCFRNCDWLRGGYPLYNDSSKPKGVRILRASLGRNFAMKHVAVTSWDNVLLKKLQCWKDVV